MRRSFRNSCIFGVVLAALFVLSAETALAASSSTTRTIVTTRTGQETLTISPKGCATLKALVRPEVATNPNLCQVVHTWTETDTQVVPLANLVTPYAGACWNGTKSFHDYTQGGGTPVPLWELDMNTTFKWTNVNVCNAQPQLTAYQCFPNFLRNTDISDQRCYLYHYYSSSGWSSTANVYTAFLTEHQFWGTNSFYNSQRRECYSNNSDGCNWTEWQGM